MMRNTCLCRDLREERFRQKKQPVQRPCGRSVMVCLSSIEEASVAAME